MKVRKCLSSYQKTTSFPIGHMCWYLLLCFFTGLITVIFWWIIWASLVRLGCISYEFYWIWIFCITSTLAFYVILTGYSPNCTFELQTCEVFSLNYFSDFTTCSSGEVCSHKNLVFRLKHILVLFLYFLFCGLAILGRACHQVSSICAKSRDTINILCLCKI